MKTFTFTRLAGAAGISALLMLPGNAAFASEDGHNITLGAGAGAIAGGVLTHGSVGGIVGGAVVGGVAGHLLTPEKKKSYADNHRRARKHVEPRRDRDSDYDSDGNYIYRR
jgi:osmotically inducible lipoprotein OsmB